MAPAHVGCRMPVLPLGKRRAFLFWQRRRPAMAAAPMLLVLLQALTACDAPPPVAERAISVQDDAGRQVQLAEPAQRVVSLVPARTEVLLALGAADRLVARTQYDGDPRIAHIPSVGNALNPSVEWIAARRPDLVIAWPDTEARAIISRLADLGIAVYGTRVETLEENDRSIAALGRLLGLEPQADSLRAALDAQLGEVRRSVAGRPRLRVLYAVGTEPPVAAGAGTFIDELITIAGGENIAADVTGRWPQVSLEEVLRRDPDRIILALGGADVRAAERVARLPGWRDLRAVRQGQLHVVDADRMNRSGPYVADAARILAALLHGESAADVR
jgi:iron complex transport system substrate-binding protein